MLGTLAVIMIALSGTQAHSWVGCTDYRALNTSYLALGAFDRSLCMGYPRNFQTQHTQELTNGWAIDTGYDWEHAQCHFGYSSTEYSDTTPMAVYTAGSVVHISHPSKNHVADTCTNPFISSTSLQLLMSSEPMVDTFDMNVTMVGEDHANGQIDHMGFQNCFQFCANMDKAHCLTSWSLPIVKTPGRYSFMWLWQFNTGQFYSTCFDAMVLVSGNQTMPTPAVTMPLAPATLASTYTVPSTEGPQSTSTRVPTEGPQSTSTRVPTEGPQSTSTVPAQALITSDSVQLKSILTELLQSIRVAVEGSWNITVYLP